VKLRLVGEVWVHLLRSGTVQLYQAFNGWSWFFGLSEVQARVVGVGLEGCDGGLWSLCGADVRFGVMW